MITIDNMIASSGTPSIRNPESAVFIPLPRLELSTKGINKGDNCPIIKTKVPVINRFEGIFFSTASILTIL